MKCSRLLRLVQEIVKTAIENGICMFDEAENYADGKSELELGRVLKELGVRRADFVITSKVISKHFARLWKRYVLHVSVPGVLGYSTWPKQHGFVAQTVRALLNLTSPAYMLFTA